MGHATARACAAARIPACVPCHCPGIVNTVSDVPERWSKASVYPDMWADPGEDPRGDGASPDGELATLQDYLGTTG